MGLLGRWHAWALTLIVCLAAAWLPAHVHADDPAPPPARSAAAPLAQFKAIPAARAAKNVAVITIRGEIDKWTERSVRRRIKAAEAAGADAIVFDIHTPGGSGMAMMAISSAIKSSSIANTVAWVNSDAYSAGAVIALACRAIVVNDNAALGDALPIEISLFEGLKPLPDAEREKFLGPIMADVIDSARRNGYDEVMVQGFLRRGIELWLIEREGTGERYFVSAKEYELAVGAEPSRDGTPMVPSITSTDANRGKPVVPPQPSGADDRLPTVDIRPEAAYVPAAPDVTPRLVHDVNSALRDRNAADSTRPDFASPEHKHKYKLVSYIADGRGMLTFRTEGLLRYKIATEQVRNDQELQAYFGATNMSRLDETWSEHLARFLSQFWVRGLLITIFIIALFIEMTHPGVTLPGAIAAVALVALLAPLVVVNMAAWWMVAAILGGVLMIMLELFVLPGTGIFGIVGALCLFGGLVGAAVGGPQNLFPGAGGTSADLTWGLATALISIVTAFIVIGLIARHLPSLPFLDRIVLKDDPDAAATVLSTSIAHTGPVKKGAKGVAITPLRPAGRVQIGDDIVDVVAEMGVIAPGTPVRVVSVDAFRTVVEPIVEPPTPNTSIEN